MNKQTLCSELQKQRDKLHHIHMQLFFFWPSSTTHTFHLLKDTVFKSELIILTFLNHKRRDVVPLHATHVLSVSCEVSKLHHLIAKLAENLYKFLEGADSFQMVEGYQDLRGERRSEWHSEQKHMVCVPLVHPHCNDLFLIKQNISRRRHVYIIYWTNISIYVSDFYVLFLC